jgi:NAD-dependent deacetylase sirtuin 5
MKMAVSRAKITTIRQICAPVLMVHKYDCIGSQSFFFVLMIATDALNDDDAVRSAAAPHFRPPVSPGLIVDNNFAVSSQGLPSFDLTKMSSGEVPDYSAVVSATGFLRPRASRSLQTFHDHITTSHRTLALLGAGLSAPSGIPTYRGAGGIWRTHDVTQLATPAGFESDPALVWTFELERRRMIKEASPNSAHSALARFAAQNKEFLALTMNIDDLSERAGHPEGQLYHLHGSIFDVKCTKCNTVRKSDEADQAIRSLLDHDFTIALTRDHIPHCSTETCDGLLRPGVVWFTESVSQSMMKTIHDWINDPEDKTTTINTMLVIGTSALVYPATAYIEAARRKGGRVVVVDIEKEDPSLLGLEEQDWYFQGDAAELVPKMLAPVI